MLQKGFLFGLNTLCEKEWVVRKRKAGNEFSGCGVGRSGDAKRLMHNCFNFLQFVLGEVANGKVFAAESTQRMLKADGPFLVARHQGRCARA